MLINDPEAIRNILEHFDFAHIEVRSNEIRCGRDQDSNRTAIRLKLVDNDCLYMSDFARSISKDFFSFIISEKNITFKEVIKVAKNELGITDNFLGYSSKSVFGGIFNKVSARRGEPHPPLVIDDSELSRYKDRANLRFVKDNIGVRTQRVFGLKYDIFSQRIIIPIYDICGQLIGVKGRANWNIDEDDSKYVYLIPCPMSKTLYGYSHNYSNLIDNNVYIVESEKSVMQAYEYGYKNFVAIGGNTISELQCKYLIDLNPKSIILMLDEGLDFEIIKKNIILINSYAGIFGINVGYWDYTKNIDIPHKASPTDLGRDFLEDVIANEIVWKEVRV